MVSQGRDLPRIADQPALKIAGAHFGMELDGESRADRKRLVLALRRRCEALRADLRPYQFDGYQWAMRLAAAGWGACLADDMGLGKTLQALAVLLTRAGEGAALVVAPTSLMGNWLSEARRFAPSLKLCVYGDGVNRDTLLAEVGDPIGK